MIEVIEYLDADGNSPYAKWFDLLNVVAAVKVTTAVHWMGQGNLSNVKAVGAGVYEFRIDFGPDYRIYFGKDGDRLVILLRAAPRSGRTQIMLPRKLTGATISAGNGKR